MRCRDPFPAPGLAAGKDPKSGGFLFPPDQKLGPTVMPTDASLFSQTWYSLFSISNVIGLPLERLGECLMRAVS